MTSMDAIAARIAKLEREVRQLSISEDSRNVSIGEDGIWLFKERDLTPAEKLEAQSEDEELTGDELMQYEEDSLWTPGNGPGGGGSSEDTGWVQILSVGIHAESGGLPFTAVTPIECRMINNVVYFKGIGHLSTLNGLPQSAHAIYHYARALTVPTIFRPTKYATGDDILSTRFGTVVVNAAHPTNALNLRYGPWTSPPRYTTRESSGPGATDSGGGPSPGSYARFFTNPGFPPGSELHHNHGVSDEYLNHHHRSPSLLMDASVDLDGQVKVPVGLFINFSSLSYIIN